MLKTPQNDSKSKVAPLKKKEESIKLMLLNMLTKSIDKKGG
jgi:hypothetical protein